MHMATLKHLNLCTVRKWIITIFGTVISNCVWSVCSSSPLLKPENEDILADFQMDKRGSNTCRFSLQSRFEKLAKYKNFAKINFLLNILFCLSEILLSYNFATKQILSFFDNKICFLKFILWKPYSQDSDGQNCSVLGYWIGKMKTQQKSLWYNLVLRLKNWDIK